MEFLEWWLRIQCCGCWNWRLADDAVEVAAVVGVVGVDALVVAVVVVVVVAVVAVVVVVLLLLLLLLLLFVWSISQSVSSEISLLRTAWLLQ